MLEPMSKMMVHMMQVWMRKDAPTTAWAMGTCIE